MAGSRADWTTVKLVGLMAENLAVEMVDSMVGGMAGLMVVTRAGLRVG